MAVCYQADGITCYTRPGRNQFTFAVQVVPGMQLLAFDLALYLTSCARTSTQGVLRWAYGIPEARYNPAGDWPTAMHWEGIKVRAAPYRLMSSVPYSPTRRPLSSYAFYAMSGTDIRCGAAASPCSVWRCPLPGPRLSYAESGTVTWATCGVRYCLVLPRRCYAMSDTDLGYTMGCPTQARLRNVRYYAATGTDEGYAATRRTRSLRRTTTP
eukprot:2882053-Rhodomonas_salina.1